MSAPFSSQEFHRMLQCMYAVCCHINGVSVSGQQPPNLHVLQPQTASDSAPSLQLFSGTNADRELALALGRELHEKEQRIVSITLESAEHLQQRRQAEQMLDEARRHDAAAGAQLERLNQEAAAEIVTLQAKKRKAEEELDNESKMHRQASAQVQQLTGTLLAMGAQAATLQAANAELEAKNNELQLDCCVCTDARPSVLYLPCKHLSVCDSCDTNIKASKMPCPICQAVIRTRHRGVHM